MKAVFDAERINNQLSRILFDKLKDEPDFGKLLRHPDVIIGAKIYNATTVDFEELPITETK